MEKLEDPESSEGDKPDHAFAFTIHCSPFMAEGRLWAQPGILWNPFAGHRMRYGSAYTVTVIDPGVPSQNPAAIPDTTATYCLPFTA